MLESWLLCRRARLPSAVGRRPAVLISAPWLVTSSISCPMSCISSSSMLNSATVPKLDCIEHDAFRLWFDLASEVIEGEEIERDIFDATDDEFVRSAEEPNEDEEESPAEDDSEIEGGCCRST